MSYSALKTIEPISQNFGDESAIDIGANLAESALTSGHFDEALQLSRNVAQRAARRPEWAGTIVPMRIVEAAALALKGDTPGASKALENLRGQKTPRGATWRYDGTVHYLNSAPLSPEMRRSLLAEIRRATGVPGASR